ncbi:MAG TPA: PilZ domain-containing protein [Blastocatellia bacterium]|nr:PilZ domain-containing protein [Blastocatellia bacterium]
MTAKVVSATPVHERRKARRFAVDWNVVIKGHDGLGYQIEENAVLENLSSRGAFLYLKKRLTTGQRIKLWIRVPNEDERWMLYVADVVRIEEGRGRFGTAVRFSKIRPQIASAPPPNGYVQNDAIRRSSRR